MLTLKCDIEICSENTKKIVRFSYANSIEVKTSCLNLTDTATVKVPCKMNWKGNPLTDFVRRNDEITIRAGYEEHGLETLFQGYVKDVENSTPMVITCENEMRRLKGIEVDAEIVENFDIRTMVKRYAPNLQVIAPDAMDFGTVTIERQSLAHLLDSLTGKFKWFKAFFKGKKLVMLYDLDGLEDVSVVTFDPKRNQIRDSLKYTLAEDVKVCVKATSIRRDNTKLEVTVPTDAEKNSQEYEQRHFYLPGCENNCFKPQMYKFPPSHA